MDWQTVGSWIKGNAGTSAALVGSLLTGNVPAAVAAGVALVGSATGSTEPAKAMDALQTDPATVVRLRELAVQDDENIRAHIRSIVELELADKQAEQEQTQLTIRTGDVAEDAVVRRTRPLQSWLSLLSAIAYVFTRPDPSIDVLIMLLTLPLAYAGLRQIGKGMDTLKSIKLGK